MSRTASSLSALARAEARAKKLSTDTAGPGEARLEGSGSTGGALGGIARVSVRAPRRRRVRRPRFSISVPRVRRPRGSHSARVARRRAGWGRPRFARLRRLAKGALVALIAAVVLGVAFVVVQLVRSEPSPPIRVTASSKTLTVRSRLPALPWPSTGEAAVAIAGYGKLGSSGEAAPVPIASLAKVMAAFVILRDHPLPLGRSGPELTITPADQAAYQADQAAGDSVAPVSAGETLSELQLLEALLVPSADNVGPILATWDAGSTTAFVGRMNAMAASLGMASTRYADPNGLSSSTVSTAGDQLRLAEAIAANRVLMSIVGQPQVTLPEALPLSNYDTLLGHDGVIGVKTGSTLESGGCFMFAAERNIGGKKVEVVGVVLGQTRLPWIASALNASAALIGPAFSAVHPVSVLARGTTVAQVVPSWGNPVGVTTTRAVSVVGFPGTVIRVSVHPVASATREPLPAGYEAATVTVSAGGTTQTVPAVTTAPIRAPSLSWRLERL